MKGKTNKTHKPNKKRAYTRKHYQSNDGMLTSVWGPATWHLLHTTSFNYPVVPTCEDKHHYRDFVLNLQYTLPCGKCRTNLRKNFKRLPLHWKYMQSRDTFSLYVYKLHELVNKMLNKKSGLSYNDVRDRYEHFRARCTKNTEHLVKVDKETDKLTDKAMDKETDKLKEKGCTEPIHGYKSKCILHIVPQETEGDTFQIDNKCIKHMK